MKDIVAVSKKKIMILHVCVKNLENKIIADFVLAEDIIKY